MTHLFCQDATETLLKLLHSNGTVGCAVSIALQCQKQTQTTLHGMQVSDPGITYLPVVHNQVSLAGSVLRSQPANLQMWVNQANKIK